MFRIVGIFFVFWIFLILGYCILVGNSFVVFAFIELLLKFDIYNESIVTAKIIVK